MKFNETFFNNLPTQWQDYLKESFPKNNSKLSFKSSIQITWKL